VVEAVHQSETLVEILLRLRDPGPDGFVVSPEIAVERRGRRSLLGEKARCHEQESGRDATDHLDLTGHRREPRAAGAPDYATG
jgi:hypothetical protein